MDIQYINMVIGLILLAIPLYVFYRLKTNLINSTIVAIVRMLVQMSLIGIYLKYLFLWNNPWLNILWVALMVVVASFTTLHRTHLHRRVAFLPIAAGFFCSAMVVGLYFLLFVLHTSRPFDSHYFIPVVAIMLSSMLSVAVVGLTSYYDYLHRERTYYNYLLGNGATHFEAVTPFLRHAVEKSFAPCISNIAIMGIITLPGTVTGQLLGGTPPDITIKFQIMIIVITFSASIISLVLTLYLADRRSFDVYGRLKEVRQKVDLYQTR